MAYGVLQAPGTDNGPCDGDCTHRDCAQTRAMAQEICHYCNHEIGYRHPFQQEHHKDAPTRLVHLDCALAAAEKRRHG